nr:uncharacterized protein LOC109149253 [Ipomoea batatas]
MQIRTGTFSDKQGTGCDPFFHVIYNGLPPLHLGPSPRFRLIRQRSDGKILSWGFGIEIRSDVIVDRELELKRVVCAMEIPTNSKQDFGSRDLPSKMQPPSSSIDTTASGSRPYPPPSCQDNCSFNLKLRHGGKIELGSPPKYVGGSVKCFASMNYDEWGIMTLWDKVQHMGYKIDGCRYWRFGYVIVGVIGEDENECAENETYADENLTIE